MTSHKKETLLGTLMMCVSLICLGMILGLVLGSLITNIRSPKVASSTTAASTSQWQNHGNYSFLVINIPNNAFRNREVILKTLTKFDNNHPDLEVLSFEVESSIEPHNWREERTYGIWLHHRERVPPNTKD